MGKRKNANPLCRFLIPEALLMAKDKAAPKPLGLTASGGILAGDGGRAEDWQAAASAGREMADTRSETEAPGHRVQY